MDILGKKHNELDVNKNQTGKNGVILILGMDQKTKRKNYIAEGVILPVCPHRNNHRNDAPVDLTKTTYTIRQSWILDRYEAECDNCREPHPCKGAHSHLPGTN